MLGEWKFHRGPGQQSKNVKCSQAPEVYDRRLDRYGLGEPNFSPQDTITVVLKEPNLVEHTDEDGMTHKGTWTMIYDEGFEVSVRGHKYFAFSYFKNGPRCEDSTSCDTRRSVCHVTYPGWFHNAKNPDGDSWGCYYAAKSIKGDEVDHTEQDTTELMQLNYQPENELVSRINLDTKQSWKAKIYPEFLSKTMKELHRMGGGKRYHPPAYLAGAFLQEASGVSSDPDISDIPSDHDWRNHKGQDYVGAVMNQGSCGSCYAVAVTHMLESRVRVQTNNRHKPKLSIQEVLSCSRYSQGCHGGFPFLVGKYAQDFGLASESAEPYKGHKGVRCNANAQAKVRAKDYGYVGGYYGACNHKKMLRELYDNGPLVVGFDTDAGLWHYSEGMYDATSLIQERAAQAQQQKDHPNGWGEKHGTRMHNHWEKTTHAVLVVGFGEHSQHGKYWIVQNSWGSNWGERGYFKIKRGVDHCAFESMAVRATPTLGGSEHFERKAEELGEEVNELQYEPAAPKKQDKQEKEDSDQDSGDTDAELEIPVGANGEERQTKLGESSETQHRPTLEDRIRYGKQEEDPEERQREHPTVGSQQWFNKLHKTQAKPDHLSINQLEQQDTADLNDGFEVPSFVGGF
jgi:cathepsin C